MEYAACGDIDPDNTYMLSTGGMIKHVDASEKDEFIVATETGMLYPLEKAHPDKQFIAANEQAVCQYMKMITLPKLRDCLRDMRADQRVTVDPEIAKRALVPIERMVAVNP
jgi:quinolinate synthase